MAAVPFSTVLRTESREQHNEAENTLFIVCLLAGRLGMDAYACYTAQLWFVYRALEGAAARRLADDPLAGSFVGLFGSGLRRMPPLERDLRHLYGAQWRDRVAEAALPATRAYAARVEETAATWPAGYIAHHYTRYLGDLSGGQVIRAAAERTWGLARKGDGVRFYVFDGIGSVSAFRDQYRALLDALAVDELERQRVVDECRSAFAANARVFAELGARFPRAA